MRQAERHYYDQRAAEYDDWYRGTGLFASRERPGWHAELDELRSCVTKISAGPVLDVACGTGFLTRHVPGRVTAIDQSAAMLRIAKERVPEGRLVQGDALQLPFAAGAFGCLMTCHFYGHLQGGMRVRFLAEARRVGKRILIVDAAWRAEVQPEEMQERVLLDGSRHMVYKRYFKPAELVMELGGGRVMHAGRWFVALLA